jgi:hypothetical protein
LTTFGGELGIAILFVMQEGVISGGWTAGNIGRDGDCHAETQFVQTHVQFALIPE